MARGSFGEKLKRERELREVTLQELTSATRIGPRFLEALENEEWEKLPGGVFNRGFVRSIARYLGLNEEALLGEYDLAHGTQVPSANGHPEQKAAVPPSKSKAAVVVLLLLVVIAGLAFAGIYYWTHRGALRRGTPQIPVPTTVGGAQLGTPTAPAPTEAPTAQGTTSVTPAVVPLDLVISAGAGAHVSVVADGRVVFSDQVHAGDNLHFVAKTGYEVSASDSGAVLLEMNGQAMPPLGSPGSSGTIKLSHDDLRQTGGNSQP